MDAAQALRELTELSSQITSAVVLDGDGAVVASAPDSEPVTTRLAGSARELVDAATSLGAGEGDVTRVEVELDEGALFVVRERGHTVAATTGPRPTSGLVVYDLRTCAQSIEAEAPKRRRVRKPKEAPE
jgi:predicted regulator of Ras-like GTPase activity (Roadblock/LC7/MglB family)